MYAKHKRTLKRRIIYAESFIVGRDIKADSRISDSEVERVITAAYVFKFKRSIQFQFERMALECGRNYTLKRGSYN